MAGTWVTNTIAGSTNTYVWHEPGHNMNYFQGIQTRRISPLNKIQAHWISWRLSKSVRTLFYFLDTKTDRSKGVHCNSIPIFMSHDAKSFAQPVSTQRNVTQMNQSLIARCPFFSYRIPPCIDVNPTMRLPHHRKKSLERMRSVGHWAGVTNTRGRVAVANTGPLLVVAMSITACQIYAPSQGKRKSCM